MKKKKIVNWMKKIVFGVMAMAAAFLMSANPVLADPSTGLTAAKESVVTQIKPIVDNAVIPVLLFLLAGGLVIAIVIAVYNYRKGREIELGWIIALVIGIVLVSTFSTWGWQIIGK